MGFGRFIKAVRKKAKLTQSEFGEKIGVDGRRFHWTTVSKWENDKQEPDYETLERMVALINLKMSDCLRLPDGSDTADFDAVVAAVADTLQQRAGNLAANEKKKALE